MGRILVICAQSPYPIVDGARLRTYNTAKILQRAHDVHLLIINEEPNDDIKTLSAEFDGVTTFHHDSLRHNIHQYRRAGAALITGYPIRPAYYHFSDVQRWVDDNIDRFDLCYVNYINTSSYVRSYPFVIDFVDSMSSNYIQLAEIHSYIRSLLYKTEAKRLKEYERTVAQEAERAFVTTRNDMAAIGGNNVTVLPNGVQEAYLNRHQSVDCVRGRIVFLGRMDYYPNVDAVRYFADEVFPQIRDNMGAASFMIVGSNPSEEVLTLGARDGINVTGFVDEPAEYLESATVVVAPMRYGTGIQNKVLEAMALGKPVVTTPLGATGIDAEHGTHLFVADGETAMYKWTMKVLTEPKLAADVGEAAHKKILNCYTWDAVAPTLLNGISDIVE